MNKKTYLLFWLVTMLLVLSAPKFVSAYNLSIDINPFGYANYSTPSILGEEDDSHKEEEKEEKKSEKLEIKEVKETPKIEKPENIEIKKEENKSRVIFKKNQKIEQEMRPEKVSVKFSANPKTSPVHKPEVEDVGESENDDTSEVLKERAERKNEKVEIQSETHDDGKVEIQIESRDIKAILKDTEVELDVKQNNIGLTNDKNERTELVHLPDQAMEKFLEYGITATPGSLQVGRSGDNFEYSVNAIKMQKLFGLIPHNTKFKLKLDDSDGSVTEEVISNNVFERLINLFSI